MNLGTNLQCVISVYIVCTIWVQPLCGVWTRLECDQQKNSINFKHCNESGRSNKPESTTVSFVWFVCVQERKEVEVEIHTLAE